MVSENNAKIDEKWKTKSATTELTRRPRPSLNQTRFQSPLFLAILVLKAKAHFAEKHVLRVWPKSSVTLNSIPFQDDIFQLLKKKYVKPYVGVWRAKKETRSTDVEFFFFRKRSRRSLTWTAMRLFLVAQVRDSDERKCALEFGVDIFFSLTRLWQYSKQEYGKTRWKLDVQFGDNPKIVTETKKWEDYGVFCVAMATHWRQCSTRKFTLR